MSAKWSAKHDMEPLIVKDVGEESIRELGKLQKSCCSCIKANGMFLRVAVLFVTSMFFFTCTSTDTLVSASMPTLKDKWQLTTLEIGMLYAIAPIMAIVSVFFLSFLLRRIGLRVTSVLACIFVLIGTLVFILVDGYAAKMVGRALFGFGEGPLEVVMELIAMRWFESSEETPGQTRFPSLEFAFGFNSAFGLAGALVALNLIPLFIDLLGTTTAYMIFAIFPALCLALAIFYAVVDDWATSVLELDDEEEENVGMIEVCKSLSPECWILFIMGGSLWALLYIVLVFMTDYMTEKWGYSNIESGSYASISFGVGIVSSLAAGWVVEHIGRPLLLLLVGCVLFTGACFILSLTTWTPILACVVFGLCLGLFEPTLYTCLAAVLPERGSSVAFTYSALIFQVSCFSLPFLFGYIHDTASPPSYDIVFLICGGVGVLNIILVIVLWFLAPKIQETVRIVHRQQFFRPVVRMVRNTPHHRARRHSVDVSDLESVRAKLEERGNIQDVVNVDPLTSTFFNEDPTLINILYETSNIVNPKAGEVGNSTSSYVARPITLPSNYFSKLTDGIVDLVPVTETEIDDYQQQHLVAGSSNPKEDLLATLFTSGQGQ